GTKHLKDLLDPLLYPCNTARIENVRFADLGVVEQEGGQRERAAMTVRDIEQRGERVRNRMGRRGAGHVDGLASQQGRLGHRSATLQLRIPAKLLDVL